MAELMKRVNAIELPGAVALVALAVMAGIMAAMLGEAAGEMIATGLRGVMASAWSIG